MFNQLLGRIQDFFAVSPKEARGIFGLLVVSVTALFFPLVLKQTLLASSASERAKERAVIDSLIRSVLQEKTQHTISAKRVLGTFDPNTATQEMLVELGIQLPLARRIINYREKGGVFRTKNDLLKIYGFPPELYTKLEGYIQIDASAIESDSKRNAFLDVSNGHRNPLAIQKRRKDADPHRPNVVVPFDINRADTTQLKQLKGIGSGRARIIVNYRDALGGFHSIDQFAEIYSLDSLSLQQLLRYARILSPPRKFNINEISLEQFLRHPYARKNRRAAESIIRFREQNGPFYSKADLEQIVALPVEFLELIAPYMEF